MKKENRRVDEQSDEVGRPGARESKRNRSEDRTSSREEPQIAVRRECRPSRSAQPRRRRRADSALTSAPQPVPWRISHQPSASSANPAAGHRRAGSAAALGAAAAAGSRDGSATRSSGVDRIKQDQPAPSHPRRKQKAAARVQRQRRPDQPDRPDCRFHQLLGREFLERRKHVSADPVGPQPARGRAARR